MKSITSKLVFSALGIALLASPAFAQRHHHPVRAPAQLQNNAVGTYPNPVARSGSEAQIESGAAFNTDRGY